MELLTATGTVGRLGDRAAAGGWAGAVARRPGRPQPGANTAAPESLDRITAVTPEQVAELARNLLAVPLTAAVVGPYDDEDDLPDALRALG